MLATYGHVPIPPNNTYALLIQLAKWAQKNRSEERFLGIEDLFSDKQLLQIRGKENLNGDTALTNQYRTVRMEEFLELVQAGSVFVMIALHLHCN